MFSTRNKLWRRSKQKKNKAALLTEKRHTPEKNWKLTYRRSEKLHRAKQLGIEYPRKTLRQTLDDEMPIKDE
ncbi:hypothetical protein [Flocculibacter collagenilyticus]|uniref:hypothetical protein n=1 Tax=Flocculibacter collagenilyticus TaxID=2744479 RepID=UPI0018F609C2|nr:hypothetical protein [Flocculibacter collagenilyticus]